MASTWLQRVTDYMLILLCNKKQAKLMLLTWWKVRMSLFNSLPIFINTKKILRWFMCFFAVNSLS
jgi:hypothetical protein